MTQNIFPDVEKNLKISTREIQFRSTLTYFLTGVDIWSIKSGELKLERPCLSFDRVFLPIVILFEEESS